MKKLLPILLLLLLTACLLPSAFAEEEPVVYESGDYEYILREDGSAVIITYTGYAEEIVIPSQLDGHTVTEIRNFAFSGSAFFTSITIPDSVTSIGDDAFYGCDQVVLTVEPDSYAEGWAIENGIEYNHANSRNSFFN